MSVNELVDDNEDVLISNIKDVVEYNNLFIIREETQEIINSIVEDGYSPKEIYEIEHVLACVNFNMLEKLVVELTNVLGADVVIEPAEEIKEDNGTIVFSTVVLTNHSLDVDELMVEISQIVTLCNKFDVVYDGWGTYPDGSDEE